MALRVYRHWDLSGGLQTATSFLLRKINEVINAKNGVFDTEIGSVERRPGYDQQGDTFQAGKTPLGGDVARFATASQRLAAFNNSGDTDTAVKRQSGGSWTSLFDAGEENTVVNFLNYLNEVYAVGYSASADVFMTPRNITAAWGVSTTRNLIGAPKAKQYIEFQGSIYAINVEIGGVRYPDRAYKSSPPMGVITTMRGAQISGSAGYLNVDSVRYLKAGMAIDVYTGGTDTKIWDFTITSVDKVNNRIYFAPDDETFTSGNVNTTTEVITVASNSWMTTGTPVTLTTTGAAPGGLTAGVTYYVINVSATTIKLATTAANAAAGTAINLTSGGSGTHTLTKGYTVADNDEVWLDGRKGELSILWNTDWPTPEAADFIAVPPGTDSNHSIVGAYTHNNRLFLWTRNSTLKWDGNNLITVYRKIGLAALRTVQEVSDWLLWLDATGRVRALNDATGQKEHISRGVRNWLSQISLTNLANCSAVESENRYKLYIGTISGENVRLVYNFEDNVWRPEVLAQKPIIQFNHDESGNLKPYFLSDDGKLYVDETGNDDDGVVIPFELETGPDLLGWENRKQFAGAVFFTEAASGTKVMVSVDGAQYQEVGEIKKAVQVIMYPRDLAQGRHISYKFVNSSSTDPCKIVGWSTYFNITEDTLDGRSAAE